MSGGSATPEDLEVENAYQHIGDPNNTDIRLKRLDLYTILGVPST